MNIENLKSYNRLYWLSWVIYMLLFLGMRAINIPYPRIIDPHVYYIFYMFIIMVINIYEGKRIIKYLQVFNNEKWKEFVHKNDSGIVTYKGLRLLHFIYSKEDSDDEKLLFLKRNYRKFLRFCIVVLVCFPIFSTIGALPLK